MIANNCESYDASVRDVKAGGLVNKFYYRGTHRSTLPANTVRDALKHREPIGITRVANVTGLDRLGIPVVMVIRPNSRSLAVSPGKGLDLDSAMASGLMETIELYHAERITRPLKYATWRELAYSHKMIPVDELPRTAISQFHPGKSLLWIEGADLCTHEPTWLPYELVHTDFRLPLPSGSGNFIMTSNGLASGNIWQEAVVHGLCELIERDADTLFMLNTRESQNAVRVDLETIDDPDCARLLAFYAAADVSVGVWDITSDIGVAAFRCVILDKHPNSFPSAPPVGGMGCHPVRQVALLRALTEAAQARLTLIAGSRDDFGVCRYAEVRDRRLEQMTRELLEFGGTRAFSLTPSEENASFEDDIELIKSRLRSAGLNQAIMVDLSKPELGIPVVRMIVPGLEPSLNIAEYAPGRRAIQILNARTSKDSPCA